MSTGLLHIARCLDLREKDIADAVATRDATRTLLARLAEVSAPDTGAAKVLLVLARMATTACGWIDGDLFIDLQAEGDATVVDVGTELGGGLRERLLSPFTLDAPLAEFTRAVDRVPHLVAPLRLRGKSARRMTLSATELVRRTSIPPPPIEIAVDSLFVRIEAPPLPTEGDAPALPTIEAAPVPSDPPLNELDRGWDDV
ncbi:MAG TPA: hypothetical protein VIF15_10610 [Polyangiaceae bacterium]|jgi:hypothetical protein